LEVHTILDILDDNRGLGVEGFYLNPPEGDDSDALLTFKRPTKNRCVHISVLDP